jgi:allene oxide cyclase
MKRILVLASVLAIGVAALITTSGSAKKSNGQQTIKVIEHADTDTTTDTGASGDTVGDVLTFANPIYNAKDTKKVGTDQGYCVRVVAGKSYECTWTLLLKSGHIVVNGPFYDTKSSTLSVTGGTGGYRKARGSMGLKSRKGGKEYLFTYRLSQ